MNILVLIFSIKKGGSKVCKCQLCGIWYKVDLIVPDHIWEKIKPSKEFKDSGLLCGSCIMTQIEKLGKYNMFFIEQREFEKT
jgi:hypothetical protein